MFRKFTLFLSLLLTLGFAASATVSAQEAPPLPEQADIEGLESGYARMFMPDFEAMMEAAQTPGADVSFDEDGIMMIMTSVFTFDSADNAGNALDTFGDGMAESLSGDDNIEKNDVDDLGDKAVSYTGEIEESGTTMQSTVILIQDGSMVHMIMVSGGTADEGIDTATNIGQFMVDGEPGDDDVTLNDDGTSTGGVFDLMPTADDTDLTAGLQPSTDMDFTSIMAGM